MVDIASQHAPAAQATEVLPRKVLGETANECGQSDSSHFPPTPAPRDVRLAADLMGLARSSSVTPLLTD